MEKAAAIMIGTGGWDHEVFDSCFYPNPGMDSLHKLNYYSRYFDTVEVRPTFWDESLSEMDACGWIASVAENKRFQFNVKLHSSFTHQKSIKPNITRNVRGLLQELAKADRLGALLIQFPYSFTYTSAHRYHVIKLAEIFSGFPLHVEFRHESWNQPNLLSFLGEHSLAPVNADLPRIKQLMPFITGVAGDTAYLRLHGRNEQGWLKNGLDARYDYLYNNREIREISRRLEIVSGRCKKIVVICNNTTNGKAIANAFRLSSIHKGKRISIPQETLTAFPQLTDIANPIELEPSLIEAGDYRRAM